MNSILTQYVIVFIILAAVLGWIIYKLFSKKSRNSSACSCCSLAEHCSKQSEERHEKREKELPECCVHKDSGSSSSRKS